MVNHWFLCTNHMVLWGQKMNEESINKRLDELAPSLFTHGIVRAVRFLVCYEDLLGGIDLWEHSIENIAYQGIGSEGFVRVVRMKIKQT